MAETKEGNGALDPAVGLPGSLPATIPLVAESLPSQGLEPVVGLPSLPEKKNPAKRARPFNLEVDLERSEKLPWGFNRAKKRRFLEAYEEALGNMTHACEVAGVEFSTLYKHFLGDPGFKREVDSVKAKLAQGLVGVSYNRATQPQGTQDRWKLIPAWAPQEYGEKPQVAIQVNAGEVKLADGSSI